ncbi:MAG: glycosyltransferase family 4 protein [Patescibacteria group bacterium]|nr:glycosyltransferase family 4 protein [Patescibacteria group bacterium]
MLTPYLPYPLHSGGQIRSYNLLKNLSKKHQITLFSFIRSKNEKKHIKELKKFCYDVKVFKRRKAWDPRNIILSGLTPYPFLVSIYFSKDVKKAILKELQNSDYDLIHAETFYVMPNLPSSVKIPTLLVEQTIEYAVYQRYVKDFKLFFLKPLLYFDVFKIKFWEKYYWNKATSLIAMSASDKTIMQRSVKDRKVNVVANGVDVNYFNQLKTVKPKHPTILFVGNFKWLPNKDAAKFLVGKIWPLIKKKLPQAKLWIVGKNPTNDILKLEEDKSILVTGNLKDIRTAFKTSSVLLAPIRNGRGTKYKVLEAMASQTPVVTTKLGIEGIKARGSVLTAEKAKSLAEKTIKILSNKKLAKTLSTKAKKIVDSKYNWKTISKKLDNIYLELGGA